MIKKTRRAPTAAEDDKPAPTLRERFHALRSKWGLHDNATPPSAVEATVSWDIVCAECGKKNSAGAKVL